jgi:ribosomal protein S18 acetylase RimI-like enzyme
MTAGRLLRGFRARGRALRRRLYRRYEEILELRDLARVPEFTGPRRLQIERIDPSHLPALEELCRGAPDAPSVAHMRNFVANGYGGFLARQEGEIVACMWWVDRTSAGTRHPHLVRFDIALAPDEVYLFNLFVAPGARGTGRATEFFTCVLAELRGAGYRWTRGHVAADNLTARLLYRTMHTQEVGRLTCRQFFGRLLLADGRLFVRNGPHSRPHAFDYRLIASLRRRRRPASAMP